MFTKILVIFTISIVVVNSYNINGRTPFVGNIFRIRVDNYNAHTVYSLLRDEAIIQSVQLPNEFGRNLTVTDIPAGFILNGAGQKITFQVLDDRPDYGVVRISRNLTKNQIVSDCINLETGRLHWYGGPQQFRQYWPVEKSRFVNYSYVSKEIDNTGLAERYWLNSAGSFIYVDDVTPLYISQNVDRNTLCLTANNSLPYNNRRESPSFVYYVGVGRNARDVHLKAVKQFLHQPKTIPDIRMIRHPIWSTWARYKANINESTVVQFSKEIQQYRFNNSQLEIDDDWEVCYGALTFNKSKFPNVKNLTSYLKTNGFRVTLWAHPFINKGCEPWYTEAKQKGFLVVNHLNNSDTKWWNSKQNEAAYIDFTKPAAAKWYSDRLKLLQAEGIDSFKFDAGETSWAPVDPVLNASIDRHPNALTQDYVRTVSKFGPLVEVRSGHGTQDVPVFLRMIDKDSVWGFNNGIPTLITTLLQLNMVGYGFILPDMIGGNGYNGAPGKELFIRWLQANVFMPSLQFSYVPWDYDNETIEISRKFTQLHDLATDLIVEQFRHATRSGQPVNPPIWWLDPHDEIALGIDDEFLLGDRILAAPVLRENQRSRDIYLPRGRWYDPNKNKNITGPRWLVDYPAPLDILPFFVRA